MHRIHVMRLLICSFILHCAKGCSETQFQSTEWIQVQFVSCDGTNVNDRFTKNPSTHNGKENFSAQTAWGPRHLYFVVESNRWGFSPNLGQIPLNPFRTGNVQTVPSNTDWMSICGGDLFDRHIQQTRSNCHECGLNRIVPAGSNGCVCRAGQKPGTNGVCENCPGNTYKDSPSLAACTSCVAHSTSPAGSTSAGACLCAAGRTKTGGQCVLCQGGTYKAGISDNACSACPGNSHSAEGSSASTACECNAGYSGENGGACTVCASGKYKSSSTFCTDCTAYSHSPEGSNAVGSCVCNAGYIGGSGNICSACGAGKYKFSNTSCTDCTAYSNSQAASNAVGSCVCNAGYIGQSGGICSECGAGKYKFSSTSCIDCTAHSNSPAVSNAVGSCVCNTGYIGEGGGGCSACESGKYKLDSLTCADCTAGSYALLAAQNGAASCINCQIGTYNTVQGMTECIQCEAGKFQELTAQASDTCVSCASGKFNNNTGSGSETNCTLCEASKAAGPASTGCTLCTHGQYWESTPENMCVDCADGTYKTVVGSSPCQICPHGRGFINKRTECSFLPHCAKSSYHHGETCRKCPVNHTTMVTGVAKTFAITEKSCVCIAGYERNDVGSCRACLPGFMSSGENSTCIACTRGKFSTYGGQVTCNTCPENWVSTSAGASSCVPCAFGFMATRSNTVCMPHSPESVDVTQPHEYSLGFFCVDDAQVFGLQTGAVFSMTKLIRDEWSDSALSIIKQEHSGDFVDVETMHYYNSGCPHAFLHQQPKQCPQNMFSMRLRAYIWDCVPCPAGTFKTTTTTLFSDCRPCEGGACPNFAKPCASTTQVVVTPSHPKYTEFMKT